MNGFITLHRKMIEWEWYTDLPVKSLFIHLLLMANHKPTKWRGEVVDRGQVLTGLLKLAEESGLSVQNIRTALRKLESTGELTSKVTNKYRIITIQNYSQYQDKERVEQQAEQQTTNKQLTTSNNVNNEKKKRYIPEKNRPMFIDEKNWKDLIAQRRAMKNPQTERAYLGLVKEIEKAIDNGFKLDHIVDTYCSSSWKGFKAEYMKPKGGNGNAANYERNKEPETLSAKIARKEYERRYGTEGAT